MSVFALAAAGALVASASAYAAQVDPLPSAFLEAALGAKHSDQPTAEAFATATPTSLRQIP